MTLCLNENEIEAKHLPAITSGGVMVEADLSDCSLDGAVLRLRDVSDEPFLLIFGRSHDSTMINNLVFRQRASGVYLQAVPDVCVYGKRHNHLFSDEYAWMLIGKFGNVVSSVGT